MAKFSEMLLLVKLRRKKLSMSSIPQLGRGGSRGSGGCDGAGGGASTGSIKWELRPGGLLVQKREDGGSSSSSGSGSGSDDVETIGIRVSTGVQSYGISVGATCTVGELKEVVSVVTGMEPGEQRVLFRGKEREDADHLHMVGVRDGDKVVVFQDPASRESKLRCLGAKVEMAASHCPVTIQV